MSSPPQESWSVSAAATIRVIAGQTEGLEPLSVSPNTPDWFRHEGFPDKACFNGCHGSGTTGREIRRNS
jgi:hypothetical protein